MNYKLLFITFQRKSLYSISMPLNLAVAETVRELRQNKGISQEQLAEAIDSHQVYISEIENGKKIPSLPVIYKTAKFFDLSLSAFTALIESKMN